MAQTRIWGTLDPFYEHGAVLGRKVANEGFLRGLLARDPFDAYHFFLQSPQLAAQQRKTLEARHPDLWRQGKFKILTRQELPRGLRENEYAAFHLSDCILNPASLARLRNALAKNIFPITSLTHSLSYSEYAGRFLRHLWPGTTPRDAVVATSATGREVVENIYAFLRRGYRLSPEDYPAPRVEVIPLGVDAGAFAREPAEGRREFRENLGIPEDATAFLVFGRISHSSKMDVLPILRAFQRCIIAGLDPGALFLILAGWLDDEAAGFANTLQNLAANIGLRIKIVARPGEAVKRSLYGASDVFISLSDNPQETFGLTILEAMASGLPVIASDYDGYKDMVEHGRTGFLVETIGPAETDMADMLAPLCFDNHLHLLLAQETAPDVAETARRLEALAKDPDLRVRLGQAGRERAAARFSWEIVIEAYLDLWERLGQAPVADREKSRGTAHPLETPYAGIFGGYPTRVLDDGLVVTWSRTGQAAVRGRDFPTIYEGLQNAVFAEAVRACAVLARKPIRAGELAARLAEAEPGLGLSGARYHILWCLKHDFLERAGVEA